MSERALQRGAAAVVAVAWTSLLACVADANGAVARSAPSTVSPSAAAAGTCSDTEKQRRQRALSAYKRRMLRDRAHYFRAHRSAVQRRAFVKRQSATLARLTRAARCTVERPPPPPRPAPPPPSPPPAPPPAISVDVPFVVGGGVAPDQAEVIRHGLALANGYFASRLGRVLSPAFTVYVFADREGIVAAYAQRTGNSTEHARQVWQTSTAVVQSSAIFVFLGSQSWTQAPETRIKIVAHEAFHLLQAELAGPAAFLSGLTNVPIAGPRWLSEGAAEYVAYRIAAEHGLANFEATKQRWSGAGRSVPAPLAALEIATGFVSENRPFDLAPLAVARLIEAGDENALLAYWAEIGRGRPWQAAFAAAFGRTIESFYAEFETYRRAF